MAVAMVLRPGRETRQRRECLDFGDEAVRMKAPEEARDLTGLLFRLGGQVIRRLVALAAVVSALVAQSQASRSA